MSDSLEWGGVEWSEYAAEQAAEDAAREWWEHEKAGAAQGIAGLRGMSAGMDSHTVSATLAEVARLERLAEHYLEQAEESFPLEDGTYEPDEGRSRTGLRVAEELTYLAWRLLVAARRRTGSLKGLMGLHVAESRLLALRSRIAGTTPARRPTVAHKSHRLATAVLSLTHAAHAPPREGGYASVLPAIAGGRCL